MLRWLIILVSAIALLLAGAWGWSFATKTGVLFSASDYMVSELADGELDPTATDEPIGKRCDYIVYNGVHSLILLDRNRTGLVDQELSGDVEMVDSWYDARCPATRAASH